jgi:hypothetical protein
MILGVVGLFGLVFFVMEFVSVVALEVSFSSALAVDLSTMDVKGGTGLDT